MAVPADELKADNVRFASIWHDKKSSYSFRTNAKEHGSIVFGRN